MVADALAGAVEDTRKLQAKTRRRAALMTDQVASGDRNPCAKLRVMAVIAIAEMFGISGRRAQLATLLERFGGWAGGEPGCRRYIFAATLTKDPQQARLVSEWETQEALDAHYRSEAFADFQLSLDGLLARPSESTVYSAEAPVRPLNARPIDHRDAELRPEVAVRTCPLPSAVAFQAGRGGGARRGLGDVVVADNIGGERDNQISVMGSPAWLATS